MRELLREPRVRILLSVILIMTLVNTLSIFDISVENKYPQTLIVHDHTPYDLEDYVKTVAYDIFLLDTAEIIIVEVSAIQEGRYQVYGFVEQTQFPHIYTIYLTKCIADGRLIETVNHEMAHLQQLKSGRLVPFGYGYVMWENKMYNIDITPYDQRPWEQEALEIEDYLSEMFK